MSRLAPILERLGVEGAFQFLEASRFPDLVFLHLPTVIEVGGEEELASILDRLDPLLPEDGRLRALTGEDVVELSREERSVPDVRYPLYLHVEVEPPGWPGLVATIRRLRTECPWDARQTHHTLARHLIEEAHEVIDAIGALPPEAPGGSPDEAAYAALRGELGDLLLQAIFHATLAREAGRFDVEEVAEVTRRKLVRRHPHVFGDVVVDDAGQVIRNWERLKQEDEGRTSLMDDVSGSLPGLVRAAKVQRRAASVGFDWDQPGPVVDKIGEELGELRSVLDDPVRAEEELGDLLFAVVNLSRHLHVDPEMALRRAADRFAERFRAMEAEGSLEGLTLEELDERWERAKGDR